MSAGIPSVLLTETTRWPAPARLAIALSAVGCEVSALCRTPGNPLLKTHAVRRAFSYSGLRPLESIVAAVDVVQPHLIIPCDDRGVKHLHELHAQSLSKGESGRALAELIERSLGFPESYPIVSSRYELLRVAAEESILVPSTYRIESVQDVRACFSRQMSTLVLKADGTWGGGGVRFAESTDQAERDFLELTTLPSAAETIKRMLLNRERSWLLPRSSQPRPSVIAQSWICGRPANCAVSCWKGRVLAGIAVDVLSSDGVKGPASVVRIVDNAAMMHAAERIAARLGLSGIFGLDFMIDYEKGATYLIEMNPRCTPLCHLQMGSDHDLVGALVAQLAEHPYRPANACTENDCIAYFPQAWNTKSEFLNVSFHDIPQGEPALVQELLHPWSQRSLLGRMVDGIRRMRGQDTSSAVAFTYAIASSTHTQECKNDCAAVVSVPKVAITFLAESNQRQMAQSSDC
jgi:hypothetical protein